MKVEPIPNVLPPAAVPWYVRVLPAAVLAALTLAMFWDVLWNGGSTVLSSASGDLRAQFLPWREFGFGQLRQGNFPLWNPHLFGGTPYFAGFQSALLYPPNWLHLFLPLGVAINWIIALHIFLAGLFTYFWTRGHGLGRTAATLSGVMFMFSGEYFLHIYYGHLPHLAVMIWTPLLLWSLDQLAGTGRWYWVLLGIPVVAMQILAGHPQYVYYTGLIAVIYVVLLAICLPYRGRVLLGFVSIYLGGIGLAAVQLLAGLAATRESIRSGGLPIDMASSFSLPPQNLLTYLAPFALGNMQPMQLGDFEYSSFYFGAGLLPELCLFVSVTGICLAIFGLCRASRPWRWIWLMMVGVTVILALGAYTPLYSVLYEHLPFYGSFRGTVKFAYLLTLFLAMAAGAGFDQLVRSPKSFARTAPIVILAATVLIAAVGWWTWSTAQVPHGLWARFVGSIPANRDLYLMPEIHRPENSLPRNIVDRVTTLYADPQFLQVTAAYAGRQMAVAVGILLLVAGLWAARRWQPRVIYGLAALLVMELFLFAHSMRATMPASSPVPNVLVQRVREAAPDQRLFQCDPAMVDWAMSYGMYDLWGYDPGVLRRYGQLMWASQDADPDQATQYLPFRKESRIFQLLRGRCIFMPEGSEYPPLMLADPLGHVELIRSYRVVTDRNAIFAALKDPQFDYRSTVLLEKSPEIAIAGGTERVGRAEIVRQTTDELEIRAEVPVPQILLVTDAYAAGWKVIPLGAAPQGRYEVLPGDYALRAIPLVAGTHHFALRYDAPGFVLGRWISLLSLAVYIGLCGWAFWRMRRGTSNVQ